MQLDATWAQAVAAIGALLVVPTIVAIFRLYGRLQGAEYRTQALETRVKAFETTQDASRAQYMSIAVQLSKLDARLEMVLQEHSRVAALHRKNGGTE